jgi:FG-GAP repeat
MSFFGRPLQLTVPSQRNAHSRRVPRIPAALNAIVLLGLSLHCACVSSTTFTPEPPTVPALRLPMNNAYLGSVHSSDLRPKFVWEPSTAESSGEIRYELQFSTDSTFPASDVTTIETFETTYQPPAALPVSLVAPVGARYFWRVQACLRDSCSGYSYPWYANVGRVVNDYNCDGYSDLAAGVPGEDSVFMNAGRVRVFFGGDGAIIDNEVDGLLGGYGELGPNARVGYSVSSVGDVNGDGCADIIFGVSGFDSNMMGFVYLVQGMPGDSFDGTVDTRISTGQPSDGFGASVGGVGDANGDGFDDFYVEADSDVSRQVAVFLYYGESGTRNDIIPDGVFEFELYSASVSGAGDVNGDGAADLLIGNSVDGAAGVSAGAAYLYWGGRGDGFDSEADAVLEGRGYWDQYGQNVASAGDVNGDGFADILVANSRAEDGGRGQPGSVDLFLGGGTFDEDEDATMMGTVGNDFFGGSMRAVGDVNGDEYEDVMIGASHSDLNQVDAGKAYLYFGGLGNTFNSQSDATFEGVTGFEALGEQITGGDFDGDGVRDIAISLPGFDRNIGRVDIFLGAPQSVFDSTADAFLTGTAAGDSFGAGLAD